MILRYKYKNDKIKNSTLIHMIFNQLSIYLDTGYTLSLILQMISSWLYFIPGVIYSLFAGGLLDQFGKYRLLLFFPIFGTMLARLIMLVNYAFIETSPVEIFHLRSISSIFGGMSIYYLGYYGYSAAITAPEERAYRMALFDGSEQVR